MHNTYSRIDYIFVSKNLLPRVNETAIEVIQISDHDRVNLELMFKCDYKESVRWKINTNIFPYPNLLEKFQKDLEEKWEINEKGGGQPKIIWDTIKSVERGYACNMSNIL